MICWKRRFLLFVNLASNSTVKQTGLEGVVSAEWKGLKVGQNAGIV